MLCCLGGKRENRRGVIEETMPRRKTSKRRISWSHRDVVIVTIGIMPRIQDHWHRFVRADRPMGDQHITSRGCRTTARASRHLFHQGGV